MAITTIPWGDGSGDNIYLSAPSQTGDQSVSVTSDPNTGAARSKVVTFSASGVSPVSLTINQEAGEQEYTGVFYLSSYDTEDKSYYSLTNVANAYSTDLESTSQCSINLTRGANAETWIYFKFDTSSIPANATILSVSCKVVCRISNTSASNVESRIVQMTSGTTAKGDPSNMSTTMTTRTLSPGTWTRAELQDARVKLYAKRGTSNTSTNYTIQIRCAELTIVYRA